MKSQVKQNILTRYPKNPKLRKNIKIRLNKLQVLKNIPRTKILQKRLKQKYNKSKLTPVL